MSARKWTAWTPAQSKIEMIQSKIQNPKSKIDSPQTQSFLMRRLAEAGIKPRTKIGQNFLIDLNLQGLLVRTAQLESRDVVLEVGTGTGSVTAMMAPQVAAVVSVEIDRQLFQLASEELHGFDNVHMLQADALETKHRLNRAALEAVSRELAAAPDREFKLVANLPYDAATPILANLLALDRPPRTMTVTIQKELADRLVARPGSKDFGALSRGVQSQCRTEIVRVMPPAVFWPRPKVFSAIVHIVLVDELRNRMADRAFFHEFIHAMFLHRRKFIRSELMIVAKNRLDKAAVDRILADAGISPKIRAEQLGVDEMLRLSEAVRTALNGVA